MSLTEKVAYIKGVIEGMDFDKSTNEGKIIDLIIDLLDDVTKDVTDVYESTQTLNAYIEEIDEDLGVLEEVVYEAYEDECECECDDDCDCDDCCCDDEYDFDDCDDVKAGVITLERLVELMSLNPRKRFNIKGGIFKGARADLTVFDLEKEYTVSPDDFLSKGRSSPFTGMTVFGKCIMTMYGGRIVWQEK